MLAAIERRQARRHRQQGAARAARQARSSRPRRAGGVDVAFEASVGGGIPILRSLARGPRREPHRSVHGIVNGTTNYMLTEMEKTGAPFDVGAEARAGARLRRGRSELRRRRHRRRAQAHAAGRDGVRRRAHAEGHSRPKASAASRRSTSRRPTSSATASSCSAIAKLACAMLQEASASRRACIPTHDPGRVAAREGGRRDERDRGARRRGRADALLRRGRGRAADRERRRRGPDGDRARDPARQRGPRGAALVPARRAASRSRSCPLGELVGALSICASPRATTGRARQHRRRARRARHQHRVGDPEEAGTP